MILYGPTSNKTTLIKRTLDSHSKDEVCVGETSILEEINNTQHFCKFIVETESLTQLSPAVITGTTVVYCPAHTNKQC